MTATQDSAPLDEVMLAMDVVDTLRHRDDLVMRELNGEAREKALLDKLREVYHQQGIEVSDAVLREGVKALSESRFAYTPPKAGFATAMARLYVLRKRWAPPVLAILIALAIGFGGYYLAWRPYVNAQAEAQQVELTQALPAQMDALYQTIFQETKVQDAANEADQLRIRGKAAAVEGNRDAAERAIADLTALRDQLRLEYTLRIVSRPDQKSAVWTFPEENTAASNYYLIVEAIDPDGKALTLPITNEENQQTEKVAIWGVRVPEAVYRSVEADKRDDGILQRAVVGIKDFGFLDVDYTLPVLGGAITRW